jgi:uncharacterized protein (DUF58 family)
MDMDMDMEMTPDPGATPERVLQRLDWTVIRRLDGLLQGDYRSLFYGFGLDLADIREYQPGDDIRYMDWNVTARLDSPYVRQYIEDREITAWFLLDLSPSMDFGTTQSLKRDRLVDFVGVLARLLTRHGNRVGALLFDSQLRRLVPPRGGRPQVLRIIQDVQRQPRLSRTAMTDLNGLLQVAAHTIRRRSLVFVISDFISSPGWERLLEFLARRHDLLAVQLGDPRESSLPDMGVVVMEDAETGQQLYVDTGDARFRARFQEAAVRRQASLDAIFRQAGVDVLSLSTEGDLVASIVRFSELRRQRKRRSGARR